MKEIGPSSIATSQIYNFDQAGLSRLCRTRGYFYGGISCENDRLGPHQNKRKNKWYRRRDKEENLYTQRAEPAFSILEPMGINEWAIKYWMQEEEEEGVVALRRRGSLQEFQQN